MFFRWSFTKPFPLIDSEVKKYCVVLKLAPSTRQSGLTTDKTESWRKRRVCHGRSRQAIDLLLEVMMLTMTMRLGCEQRVPIGRETIGTNKIKKEKVQSFNWETKEVVSDAEGISQISENSYKLTTTSTIPRNRQSRNGEVRQKTVRSQVIAKFLQKVEIQVALNKRRKMKGCPSVVSRNQNQGTPLQKLTLHVGKFHGKELLILDLQRSNKVVD